MRKDRGRGRGTRDEDEKVTMNDATRQAVIDVGTNSVKLLVAEVSGAEIRPLTEISEQTRLGHGFYETRRLLPAAMDHTARVVAEFSGVAAQWGRVRRAS